MTGLQEAIAFLFRFLLWLLHGPWSATTKVEHTYEIHGAQAC